MQEVAAMYEHWSELITYVAPPEITPTVNSFIVRSPNSASVVIVDPGPSDERHMHELLSFGRTELILLTASDVVHSESAALLSKRTGAAIREIDAERCVRSNPLFDRERFSAAGCTFEVIAIGGAAQCSVALHLPFDHDFRSERGSVLTGDALRDCRSSMDPPRGVGTPFCGCAH